MRHFSPTLPTIICTLLCGVLLFGQASQAGEEPGSGVQLPALTASLRPGETITIERGCGRILRVRVVDGKGQVIFDLVEAKPEGRDCQ